jgi:hypothetical protein
MAGTSGAVRGDGNTSGGFNTVCPRLVMPMSGDDRISKEATFVNICGLNACNVNLTNGRSDPRSAIVHHKQPHKGNLTLFYDPNNLEAVCWSCHSGAIQSQETLGYDTAIGTDGWPVDAKHPSVR